MPREERKEGCVKNGLLEYWIDGSMVYEVVGVGSCSKFLTSAVLRVQVKKAVV